MIENCFNYVGSKDRIFTILDKNFDKSKKYFVDLFCGSGVVGVNETVNYEKVVLNDACWQMTKTLQYFRDNDYDTIIKKLEDTIKEYKLSKENKEGYLALREEFNSDAYHELVFDPVMFYALVTHSFNYNIHINSSGKFSVPSGYNRCYFNERLRAKLEAFQWELRDNKDRITIKNKSFDTFVKEADKIIPKTMFYVDPPYYSSDASYCRIHYLGKWTDSNEYRLYNTLDYIDSKGGSFLLSNVIENNGSTNLILKEWSRRNRFRYNVTDISSDYSKCNYQRKNKGKTVEIIVRNY